MLKRHGAAAAGWVLLAAGTLALCVPLLGGANFSPDAAEYAGIARRLAEGHGLTTALKWQFLDHGPVVRPAAIERPILYPLFGALVLKGAPSAEPILALQIANAVLAVLSAVVAVLAFSTVVSPAAARVGAVFLVLSPGFTQTATMALSDQLFLLLWLAALALLPRASGPRGAVLFGLLAGLAALTRPNGVLLALGFALFECRPAGGRRAPAPVAWMLVATLVVLLPVAHTMLAARRQGLRPGALANYSVLHIHQASWSGFATPVPSPVQLLRENPAGVLSAVGRKVRTNAKALGASPGPLLILALLPLLSRLRRRRTASAPDTCHLTPVSSTAEDDDDDDGVGHLSPVACHVSPAIRHLRCAWLTLALANFVFYSASWVAAGAVRYLLPTTALLLPLLLQAGLEGWGNGRARRALLAAVLAGALLPLGLHWNAHRRWTQERWRPAGWEVCRAAARWVDASAAPDDVVASNNPWMIHYLTRRPSLACPYFGAEADLGALARQFGVRWVMLIARPGDARVRHCLRHPAARLVRHQQRGSRPGLYLFAVQQSE